MTQRKNMKDLSKLNDIVQGWTCVREKVLKDDMFTNMKSVPVDDKELKKVMKRYNTIVKFSSESCMKSLSTSIRKIDNDKYVLYYTSVNQEICAKTGKIYDCKNCRFYRNECCRKKYPIMSFDKALKKVKRWLKENDSSVWAFHYKTTNDPTQPSNTTIVNE